jgi:hypothetical protein
MCGGETHNREAGAAIGGQPADDNPAAAPCFGDGHRREIRVASVQDSDPAPRGGNNLIDRRGEGDSQLSQRRVTDVDAGAPTMEAETIKN